VVANMRLFYTRNIMVNVKARMHIMNFTIKPRLCTAPLNRLPCYGALEVIVTLLFFSAHLHK